MNLQILLWCVFFWVKVIWLQWWYVLCNGIVMCFVLSIVYVLDFDEFYWVMMFVVVVSFFIVGGVISKSFGCIVGSLFGVCVVLLFVGYIFNDFWLFLFSIFGWLVFCIWVCVLFINNVVYVFQLVGYICVIIVFLVINISDSYELWVIVQLCVCEVIVGIFCGGLMMMILLSIFDGSNLLMVLKIMYVWLLEYVSLLWVLEMMDVICIVYESVIGQILIMNLLCIQVFWSYYCFCWQNFLLNYFLYQQFRMISVIFSL